MPLPENEKIIETGTALVNTMKGIFGTPPGLRPVHAKGVLLKGSFQPTETAKALSKAPHFNNPSTTVIARFSNSTGIPHIPDTDPNANPRGLAVRFQLAESPRRVHTDIIAHSANGFPVRTGEEMLQLFQAIAAGKAPEFLGSHPTALAFAQSPKPTPSSFSREKFFAVNAFKFVAADGKETFVRYRILPEAGENYLDETATKDKSNDFLFDDVSKLVENGAILFKLVGQIAEGDPTDDATKQWPEERKLVELGTIKLDSLVEHDAEEQRKIIYDPVPRVDGIESSDDPLLEARAGVYLLSGRERRAAADAAKFA